MVRPAERHRDHRQHRYQRTAQPCTHTDRAARWPTLPILGQRSLEGLNLLRELRSPQRRIEEEQAQANIWIQSASYESKDAAGALDDALAIINNCHANCLAATPHLRRLMNQALFERLLLNADALDSHPQPLYARINRAGCQETRPGKPQAPENDQDPPSLGALVPTSNNGADERTRTSTWFPRHGPEPCASTNSATSASGREAKISHGPRRPAAPGSRCEGCLQRFRVGACSGRFASLVAVDRAPLSSRGLGRRPLMAETRVRIPVAVLDSPRIYGAFRVSGVLTERLTESRCGSAPKSRPRHGSVVLPLLRDTGRAMSEESTTPDLVELVRKQFEALNRRDLDGVMSSVAEDGVLDGRADLIEGRAAIRGFLDEWFGAYEELDYELEEVSRPRRWGCVCSGDSGRASGWQPRPCSTTRGMGLPLGGRLDRSPYDLRGRRGPCCRRTPRRGTGVGDVGEPGPCALDLRGLGTRATSARPTGRIPRSSCVWPTVPNRAAGRAWPGWRRPWRDLLERVGRVLASERRGVPRARRRARPRAHPTAADAARRAAWTLGAAMTRRARTCSTSATAR